MPSKQQQLTRRAEGQDGCGPSILPYRTQMAAAKAGMEYIGQ